MTSFDWYAIGCSMLLTMVVYFVLGERPRRFYKHVRNKIKQALSYRLITKDELESLHRQIAAYEEQIRLLHTAPIKQEKGGQLGFGDMFTAVESSTPNFVRRGPFPGDDSEHVWYQVWRPEDLSRWQAGETLVKRETKTNGKSRVRRMWVTDTQKGDVEIQPYKWEEAARQ